jgi:hypothetical protein
MLTPTQETWGQVFAQHWSDTRETINTAADAFKASHPVLDLIRDAPGVLLAVDQTGIVVRSDDTYRHITTYIDTMANVCVMAYVDVPEHVRHLIMPESQCIRGTNNEVSPTVGRIDAEVLGIIFFEAFAEGIGHSRAIYLPWLIQSTSIHVGRPLIGTNALRGLGANLELSPDTSGGTLSILPQCDEDGREYRFSIPTL